MFIVLFSADTAGDDDMQRFEIIPGEDGSVIMIPLDTGAEAGEAGTSQSCATPIPVTPVTSAAKRKRSSSSHSAHTNTGDMYMEEYFRTKTKESVTKEKYYELKMKKIQIEIDNLQIQKDQTGNL